MQQEVDQEAIDKKMVLDMAKLPQRDIGFQPFPQMLYKHPKDKAKEHITRIVRDKQEREQQIKNGWVEKPHIPVIPEVHPDFE